MNYLINESRWRWLAKVAVILSKLTILAIFTENSSKQPLTQRFTLFSFFRISLNYTISHKKICNFQKFFLPLPPLRGYRATLRRDPKAYQQRYSSTLAWMQSLKTPRHPLFFEEFSIYHTSYSSKFTKLNCTVPAE